MSFDFNVSYSSRWGYSLINTLELKKSHCLKYRHWLISSKNGELRCAECDMRGFPSGCGLATRVSSCQIPSWHTKVYKSRVSHWKETTKGGVGYMLFVVGNSSVTPYVCIVYILCSLCTFFSLVSGMFSFLSHMARPLEGGVDGTVQQALDARSCSRSTSVRWRCLAGWRPDTVQPLYVDKTISLI